MRRKTCASRHSAWTPHVRMSAHFSSKIWPISATAFGQVCLRSLGRCSDLRRTPQGVRRARPPPGRLRDAEKSSTKRPKGRPMSDEFDQFHRLRPFSSRSDVVQIRALSISIRAVVRANAARGFWEDSVRKVLCREDRPRDPSDTKDRRFVCIFSVCNRPQIPCRECVCLLLIGRRLPSRMRVCF